MTQTLVDAPTWPYTSTSHLRCADGRIFSLDVDRWQAAADDVDLELLARAVGPVLDVGCGPGRLVCALRERGVSALGIDVSPSAVAIARRGGARVILASIFERVPRQGAWRTALLIDGSVGIGGDPEALLRRMQDLLHPAGRVLVELEPPDEPSESLVVRVETNRRVGSWFPWARVSRADLPSLAASAGYAVAETWVEGERHFADLVPTH